MSPKHPAAPLFAGIGAPSGLLLIRFFEPGAQPTLDILDAHGVDLAQFAPQDHLTGLPHEGIAGVVVRHGEHDTGTVDDFGQPLGLGQVESERLVANDVEAGLDGRLGDLEMRVVRRGNRKEIDPLLGRQSLFLVDQFAIRAIGAGCRDVVIGGGGLGPLRIARQGAGDQGGPIVEHGGRGVNAADERALAATDQSHPQLAIECSVGGHICRGSGVKGWGPGLAGSLANRSRRSAGMIFPIVIVLVLVLSFLILIVILLVVEAEDWFLRVTDACAVLRMLFSK